MRHKSPYSGISEPKYQRIFDKETYQFYTAVSTEESANKIAEELRKSNAFGTLMGTMARVYHLPKSQAKIEFIFNEPHYYRWAVYVRPYKLPQEEADRRTRIMEQENEAGWQDFINTHYESYFNDLRTSTNRAVTYRLFTAVQNIKLPWQADYTAQEKKAILKQYRILSGGGYW